jgi:hypothetical protein
MQVLKSPRLPTQVLEIKSATSRYIRTNMLHKMVISCIMLVILPSGCTIFSLQRVDEFFLFPCIGHYLKKLGINITLFQSSQS